MDQLTKQIIIEGNSAFIYTELKIQEHSPMTQINIDTFIWERRKLIANAIKLRYEECVESVKNGTVVSINEDYIKYIDSNNTVRHFSMAAQNAMIECYNMLLSEKQLYITNSMCYQIIKSFVYFEKVGLLSYERELIMTYFLESLKEIC